MVKKHDYISAVGRRKSAIARVRLSAKEADGLKITVNGRDMKDFFMYQEWQNVVTSPLTLTGNLKREVSVLVRGGGTNGQAEAIRHGISRALVSLDETLKATLRKAGYLTRDPRAKERKKPGLKRARRAPQWSKR
ncbi:MAG: 30S ribosomal protein S9 [Candidatus Komeilibacteria bacterium RIFCSPLOWO2_01_FULL_52_15]|uniref:Small ribosomal subunit protein uS9 n=2 Tax=Candidatus Komeiliibacteriota TaxID=1817908 RepID=A0A1G2BPB2_9BACT|nr:MAG: 30S ribosomal protein S9 [Candidatus Komeilibacteria bacterium RIFCSPHIGHO2_01_FULL_52_14]OGY90429.1 MAG: 30S ribosomal protein S9 [Candidatus Komeilibacteria bacterium RIFCSPLOWO2_01_FULL_52_15]